MWLGHAYFVPHLRLPLLIGLADPAVHGLVSVLLLWLRRVVDTPVASMAVLVGVLIDVDHAIAAGSFDFKAMLSLPRRPLGHSFLVAAGLALALRLGRVRYASGLPFYLFWVSLASHIARDVVGLAVGSTAYSGGGILWDVCAVERWTFVLRQTAARRPSC